MVELAAPGYPEALAESANSADELSGSMALNAATSRASGASVNNLSGGMRSPTGSVLGPGLRIMRGVGMEIDSGSRALRAIQGTVALNSGLMAIYSMARSTILTKTARESTIAAIETAAQVAVQNWGAIATAGATAALVAGSFAVGQQFGSGNWSIPSGNMANPTDRRTALGQMSNRVGGE